MAELLLTGDNLRPNPISRYLCQALPDDFIIVAEPVVGQCLLDAIVIGHGGLTLIAAEGGQSSPSPAPQGLRRAKMSHEQAAVATLQIFLKDTCTAPQPPVRYLAAAPDLNADTPTWRTHPAAGEASEELAAAVARAQAQEGFALSDPAQLLALGQALRTRQLTANQRTTRPFIFRGGGLLGGKAWTVREALQHIERYPAVGIYHLYNETLSNWLEQEGATDLARQARDAIAEARSDRRKALAIFLAGAGLVPRPRLVTHPKTLDLGYALTGETIVDYLHVQRGRGRGYLFGAAETDASWLKVWPLSFAGNVVDLAVTADTSQLPISAEPHQDYIILTSNAAKEPIRLPVRLRIVPDPTPVVRFLYRPGIALLMGALPGAVIGWVWGRVAPALPPALVSAVGLDAGTLWLLAVLAFWALVGLIRGLCQPLPWPIAHAARRWLIRLALWAPALMLAGLGLALWWESNFGTPGAAYSRLHAQAVVAGLAVATVPATIFASQRRPPPMLLPPEPLVYLASDDAQPKGRYSWRRERMRKTIWGSMALLLVILALIIAPHLTRLAEKDPSYPAAVQGVYGWIETQWEKLNATLNDLVDQLYLRYYDRRAPAPAALPDPPNATDAGRAGP